MTSVAGFVVWWKAKSPCTLTRLVRQGFGNWILSIRYRFLATIGFGQASTTTMAATKFLRQFGAGGNNQWPYRSGLFVLQKRIGAVGCFSGYFLVAEDVFVNRFFHLFANWLHERDRKFCTGKYWLDNCFRLQTHNGQDLAHICLRDPRARSDQTTSSRACSTP